MALPPRFTADLRDRITLSELVGRRVRLARAGREFRGCCPFHKEKTPSFYVNDDKQFYHCFGCAAHGDAIDFVMQHDNLSFIEAVETLAAQAGMQVPQSSPQEVEQARRQKDLYSLMDETAQYFASVLDGREGNDARQYLADRGVPQEIIDSFRLGFSPADGQALRKHLKDKGYTDQQMIDAGMIRRSDRGGEPYAFFRDRVMFPVADRRGRIVAFGARVLPEHLRPVPEGAHKPPKYINSGETALFHKGRMLYGESHARRAAADGQPVVVVEGYLDVMACFQAGWRGAVAPLGTALTEEQIVILWKMIPQESKIPVLCFDGDEAGRRAAARACERLLPLLQPDQSAVFAFLPEGQDPDSLLRAQGKKALEAILQSAMPLVDFLWNYHTQGRRLETPEDRAGLEKALEEDTARIADRGVQQHYRQVFRDKLFSLFRRDRAPRRAGGKRQDEPLLKMRRPAFSQMPLTQQILLAAVINHPFVFEAVEEDLARMRMAQARLDGLRQAVLQALGTDPALDREGLLNHLKSLGYEEELELVLGEAVYLHAGFARPAAQPEDVLPGWREAWRLLQDKAVRKEIHAAGQVLAQDLNEENERRIMALHHAHKASEA